MEIRNLITEIENPEKATQEATFNTEDVLVFTSDMCDELKRRASISPRKRYRLCLHQTHDSLIQEMVIVAHKDTFMPPHRHPLGKTESYHVIEGQMTVYLFNDGGDVIGNFDLAGASSDLPHLYRLSGRHWHMPVPQSEWLIYHECFTGPFEKDRDVEYPSWLPNEENDMEVRDFLDRVQKVKL